jgi:putative endonuclease
MLAAHGCVIIERNWRCAAGELDLVARDGEVWVFVEVKLRRGVSYGTPEEAVTLSKQRRLLQLGLAYIDAHNLDDAHWRVDVVGVYLNSAGKVERLTWHQEAVRADE